MDEWIQKKHPLYTSMKDIGGLHMNKNDKRKVIRALSKWIWTKWTTTIISPSDSTNNKYESMKKNWTISRYDTLEEAMNYNQ
jgi:hypothetical protein